MNSLRERLGNEFFMEINKKVFFHIDFQFWTAKEKKSDQKLSHVIFLIAKVTMSLLIVEKTDIFFIAFEELKRVIRFAYGPRQFGKRVNKSDECTLN